MLATRHQRTQIVYRKDSIGDSIPSHGSARTPTAEEAISGPVPLIETESFSPDALVAAETFPNETL